jgi:hypothetical protein
MTGHTSDTGTVFEDDDASLFDSVPIPAAATSMRSSGNTA